MGLFGSRAAKQARADPADTEVRRLVALSTHELAAEIMPAFGPNGINAKSGHQQGPTEVAIWLLPESPITHRQPVFGPITEALGVLEHCRARDAAFIWQPR
jgi:hypothetical protein